MYVNMYFSYTYESCFYTYRHVGMPKQFQVLCRCYARLGYVIPIPTSGQSQVGYMTVTDSKSWHSARNTHHAHDPVMLLTHIAIVSCILSLCFIIFVLDVLIVIVTFTYVL